MDDYLFFSGAAIGMLGLYLAGNKDRRGWLVGLANQTLWVVYASISHHWAFYFTAVGYACIYIRNATAWIETDDIEHRIFTRQIFTFMWLPGWVVDPRRRCKHGYYKRLYGDNVEVPNGKRHRCLSCGRKFKKENSDG